MALKRAHGPGALIPIDVFRPLPGGRGAARELAASMWEPEAMNKVRAELGGSIKLERAGRDTKERGLEEISSSGVISNCIRRPIRAPKSSIHARRSVTACAAIMGLAALLMTGCREEQVKPDEVAAPNHGEKSAPVTAPSAQGAPAPSATQSASAELGPASPTGTWEGSYNAKKGTVELPAKVKDKTRHRDDGTTAVGPGTVTLIIAPDGELSGTAKGALGEATLRGKAEGDMIRASVFPDNPALPNAMTGVLVGMMRDGVIRAEIRVAGPDATIVRESPIELKRK